MVVFCEICCTIRQNVLEREMMSELIELIAASGFIIGVILSLVEWIKQTKLPAVYYPYASMGVGIVFGIAYQYYRAPLINFGGWFIAVVYGLVLGLVASGVYKVGASLAKKAAASNTPEPNGP